MAAPAPGAPVGLKSEFHVTFGVWTIVHVTVKLLSGPQSSSSAEGLRRSVDVGVDQTGSI